MYISFSADLIHFVVTNHGNCPLELETAASVMDLKISISMMCNFSLPFEIHLFEEAIVTRQTPINQKVVEIPSIIPVVNALRQIWGNGFRIPVTVHPIIATVRNMTILDSLSSLIGGADSNVYQLDWYRFIIQCAASDSCSVQDLCDRFTGQFLCVSGYLITIKLSQLKLTGQIDLTFLPSTVVTLMLDRNLFSEIIGLDRLAGKYLENMNVQHNPFDFDLEPFTNASLRAMDNPLRHLRVSAHQIGGTLLGIHQKSRPENDRVQELLSVAVHQAVACWLPSSILKYMVVGRKHFRRQNSDLFTCTPRSTRKWVSFH